MPNTGYIINPYVKQIFTSGPNSGSGVNNLFDIEFDISSSFTSSIVCNDIYNYKIFNPIQCNISGGYCIYPTIIEITPFECTRFSFYRYSIEYNTNDVSIDNSIIEYSLTSDFTGEVGSTLLLNGSDPNATIIDISDGLSILPLNGNIYIYFRIKNICISGDSIYSNIISSNCVI